MMSVRPLLLLCLASVLYAADEEVKKCIFAKPGTPYHDKTLCTMDDLNETVFQGYNYSSASIFIAEILDRRNGTKVVKYPNIKTIDSIMPKKEVPDPEHNYFVKNVASFLGEEWVYGQNPRWRKIKSSWMGIETKIEELKVDGGTVEQSVWFLKSFLSSQTPNYYDLDISSLMDDSKRDIIDSVLKKLDDVVMFEHIIFGSGASVPEKADIMANYFAGLLEPMREWLIPVYFLSAFGGHVILISFVKTDQEHVDLTVYNTGDGVNFHDELQGNRHLRYNFALKFSGLHAEHDLLNTAFFDMLIEFTTGQKKGEKYDADLFYNNVLGQFSKYRVAPSENHLDYSLPQKAGNCYQKVVLAYIKAKLGYHDYKKLEREMRIKLMNKLYESEFYNKNWFQQELVVRGLKSQARTLTRLYKKGDLRKESLGESIEVIKKRLSVVQSLKLDRYTGINAVDKFAFRAWIHPGHSDDASPGKRGSETSLDGSILYSEDVHMDDPEWIIKRTQEISGYVSSRTRSGAAYHGFALMIKLPLPSADGEDVYRNFTPDQFSELFTELKSLVKNISEKSTRVVAAIVTVKFMAIVWRYIISVGGPLAEYKLDLQALKQPFRSDKIFFYTPEMLSEYTSVLEYLEAASNQQSETSALLFEGITTKQTGKFEFMSETSAEYMYLNSIELSDEEKLKLADLERTQSIRGTSAIVKVLKEEKLRLAYLYMIKNQHVPEAFHLLRDLLTIVSELAYGQGHWSTDKFTIRFFMGSSMEHIFSIFKSSEYSSEPTISYRTQHSSTGSRTKLSFCFENSLLVKAKPFENPLKTDLDLLKEEPFETKIYFAMNCISQYFMDIFSDDLILEIIRSAFFQGRCLKEFLLSNPLDGTLHLKELFKNVSHKLYSTALLTEKWSAYNSCKDLEALVHHWLGTAVINSLEPRDCPAAYLGNAEALFFIGKKPKYLQGIYAIALKDAYPHDFVTNLLKHEKIVKKLVQLGINEDKQEEILRHEYPYVSADVDGITYIYDFWEDELFSGKMVKDKIYENDVLKDCEKKSEYLESLAESGEFSFGPNRYGLVNKTICKIVNGASYVAVNSSRKPLMPLSSFKAFENRTDKNNSSYIVDFNLSLEPEIAGKTFLEIQESKIEYDKEFKIVFENQMWKLEESGKKIPELIDNFGEARSVLIWRSDNNETLYIFTDMFTDDLKPVIFKCGTTGCFYQGMPILEETSELYKRYPQSIIFTDSDKQQFALLPMESMVNKTTKTPCIKFQVDTEKIIPLQRDKKIQLALYCLSHGLYKAALDALRSVVLIAKFTQTELIYLNNVVHYNRKQLDTRPEQVAVSYYALYMKFKLGNQELQEDREIQLFKEFSEVEGKAAGLMDSYYTLLGRIPTELLVTSPILCSPHLKNSKWIGCQDEQHFIESILKDHSRLSQINQTAGRIYASDLKNKSMKLVESFPPERYDSWSFRKTEGREIISNIRRFNSKLRCKKEDVSRLVLLILDSLDFNMTGPDRGYIESFLMSTEMDPSFSHLYLIILSVIYNPEIATEVKNQLLNMQDYRSIIRPKLEPFFQIFNIPAVSSVPAVLELPAQLTTFRNHACPELNLKEVRLKQEKTARSSVLECFEPLKESFKITSTKTDKTSSFSRLEGVLLNNSVISRPMTDEKTLEEYNEMWNKLPNSKIDLIRDEIEVKELLANSVKIFKGYAADTKKKLLDLANTPSDEHKEEFNGLITSGSLSLIKIKTLLRPYVTEDVERYHQHLKYVATENIAEIHATMHEYLVFSSVHGRFERASKAFEQGDYSKVLDEMLEFEVESDMVPVVLVMEYHLGFRIRPKNIESIQTMAKKYGSTYKNHVLQAIMGSGKTEVISPALAFLKADGEHISMFCPPSTHFETNSEKLVSYSKSIFGQESYILNFNRDPELINHDAMKKMFESLRDSIKEKKNVVVKFESLQSMVNQFIYLLNHDDGNVEETKNTGQLEELRALGMNLDLMKSKGSITFDEVDFTFKTNRMFNFPTGISQEMDNDTVETVKMVLRQSIEIEDKLSLYEIYPRRGVTQNVAKVRQTVVKLIADNLVDHFLKAIELPKPFEWTARAREDPKSQFKLVEFLVNEPLGLKTTLQSLELDENQIKFMILVQNLVQSLIPDNWATVCNLHYGFSKYADLKPSDSLYCGVAKPYAFAGEPKEGSSWANKYETAVKTFQMYLENGISEQQYVHYVMHLQKKALDEAIYYEKSLEATDALLRFNSYQLVNEGEKVKLFHSTSEASNCLSPSTKALMVKNLKQTNDPNLVELILDFVFEIPMKKEWFYSSQIVNNAQFMGTRFKILQGFSGTAQRDYQFWENVDFIPDLGSSVAVQSTILEQPGLVYEIEDENDAIYLANSDRTGEFNLSAADGGSHRVSWVNKGFTAGFKIFKAQEGSIFEDVNKAEKVKAMIDLGAFFRTMKNEEVARKLLQYSGNEIKSIVYYNQANKLSFMKKAPLDHTEQLVVEGPYELHGENHKDILKETGCSLDEIFVYYDQKHILGSDFKMVDGAVAYVTVGPTTTRTDLEQAVMRMRGLLAKLQTLRFIISKEVASSITSKKKETGDGNEVISLFGIIRHSIDNESQLFKSTDESGRINMQNMQLLYQKVKAQYMDTAFTHLTRLASNGEIDTARLLFKDVHDWFIDATDEFAAIDESNYYETTQVLLGYSDRMFDHLSMIPRWKVVETELLKAKEAAENAIHTFMKRNIVEPKTPSPVSRKNQNSTEVQNENQNQNQTQTQNQMDITISSEPQYDYENEYLEPNCSTATVAAMQMHNYLRSNNMSFFDDNIKISSNFSKIEKTETYPFIKTPAYFLRLEKCIIAISHQELEWIGKKDRKYTNLFILVEDKPVWLSGSESQNQLTKNDLVNLLIFKGDFESLNKNKYETELLEWTKKRVYFGPELIPIIGSYDIRRTGLFNASTFREMLEKSLLSRESIPMNAYSSSEMEFFKENPRLGLEIIFRKSVPSFEELIEYYPLGKFREMFIENDARSIASLQKLNPNFVISIDNMWSLAKGNDMQKFEPLFKDDQGKTLDISVSDALGLLFAAGRKRESRDATSKFMRFASDKRIAQLVGMFFSPDRSKEKEDLAVLTELFEEFPRDFKECPYLRDMIFDFITYPRQSVMILHIYNLIGTTHEQWIEIYKKYFDCPEMFMHIELEVLLKLSNLSVRFEQEPSFMDEFVDIIKQKREYPESYIQRISAYLLEQQSSLFEEFTKKHDCTFATLIHSIGIDHVDEVRLIKAIKENTSRDEIVAIAFDLMNNPQKDPNPDLFALIPHDTREHSLVGTLFRHHNFMMGLYICGLFGIIEKRELSSVIGKYAEELSSHPEYFDEAIKQLSGRYRKDEYDALIAALDEHHIPYTIAETKT